MSRVALLALSCVAALSTAAPQALAAAKVKSHSNTNNNRAFATACTQAGGAADTTGGTPTCRLPQTTKSAAIPADLANACVKDGGQAVTQNGAVVCKGARPADASS